MTRQNRIAIAQHLRRRQRIVSPWRALKAWRCTYEGFMGRCGELGRRTSRGIRCDAHNPDIERPFAGVFYHREAP